MLTKQDTKFAMFRLHVKTNSVEYLHDGVMTDSTSKN